MPSFGLCDKINAMKQKTVGLDRLEWVILLTDHYQKSIPFYKDILGLHLQREDSKEKFAQFQLKNDCYLAIYGRKEFEKLVGKKALGKAGGAIYAFAETADVDKAFKALVDRGVPFIKEPTTMPWGQRTAYFRDPDGHIWEIQQWVKDN